MSKLDHAEMGRLGLYRISPGVVGWLLELLQTPALLFIFLFALAYAFAGSRAYAVEIAAIPAGLSMLPTVTLFLHLLMERRSSRTDILYLRSYAKPDLLGHALTRDVGVLQMVVRGILRPPFDTVSLFPPASSPEEEEQDRRRKLKRGIHHVFTLRTKDDDTWKAAIEHLMGEARLVIVECHEVDGGFAWELDRIPEIADLGKVLLVSDETGQEHADEIRTRVLGSASGAGANADEVPLFIMDSAPGSTFKDDLLAAVRERAPDFDEVAQARALAILVEVALKVLTIALTFLWWLSVVVAIVTVGMLAI